jgi:hypothetical protein
MRLILLATAAVTLISISTASFAAIGSQQGNSSSVSQNCADILANKSAYSQGDVEYCSHQQ